MKKYPEKPQLYMIWPQDKLATFSEPKTAPRYVIRTYQRGDETAFLALMSQTDFDPWDDEKLRYNMARIIPEGWFFAVETHTEHIVATAMCLHNYSGHTPFAGDVGWLACEQVHRGHGLGYALTAHVTNRFLRAGYTKIQLHTEYYRLAAIRTYLKIGYMPVMYCPAMYPLWQEACEQIGWEYMPDSWPQSAQTA